MDHIFKEYSIGKLKLKNRIIRSATHEGMANENGIPSESLIEFYKKLASGGAGAIITGYVGVKQNGRTLSNMGMLNKEELIEPYKKITESLKKHETPVIVQLAHGGSKSNSKVTNSPVVTPSYIKKNAYGDECLEASEDEIKDIINAFVNSIYYAKKAGFDGVQLHAAHGYLLSEFLSPAINKRTDQWGGSVENRFRIIKEILVNARNRVGVFPILIKMSAFDENKNGLTDSEVVEIAKMLEKNSCDAIEVSCGYGDFFNTIRMPEFPEEGMFNLSSFYKSLPPVKQKVLKKLGRIAVKNYSPLYNYNVPKAELIKENINIPVIVVGGIRKLEDIKSIIEVKGIDCVSMSRPFVIEPDIVNKFFEGRQDSSRCIDCGYCLFGVFENALKCYYGKVK
jgi:2,4-dienoyl-CoA reductase-like NADH-dependent reductase (Old Yellow Enzyme family)